MLKSRSCSSVSSSFEKLLYMDLKKLNMLSNWNNAVFITESFTNLKSHLNPKVSINRTAWYV